MLYQVIFIIRPIRMSWNRNKLIRMCIITHISCLLFHLISLWNVRNSFFFNFNVIFPRISERSKVSIEYNIIILITCIGLDHLSILIFYIINIYFLHSKNRNGRVPWQNCSTNWFKFFSRQYIQKRWKGCWNQR